MRGGEMSCIIRDRVTHPGEKVSLSLGVGGERNQIILFFKRKFLKVCVHFAQFPPVIISLNYSWDFNRAWRESTFVLLPERDTNINCLIDDDEPAPGRLRPINITNNYAYSSPEEEEGEGERRNDEDEDDSLEGSSLDISLSNSLPLPHTSSILPCDTSRTGRGGLGLVQTFTLAGGSCVEVEDPQANTQIAIERRRRLGLIRSEIFDLNLQLDELHPGKTN
jgi:hypothetical protein